MCQGTCSADTCQQTCSPADAHLRQVLGDIQTLASQQLQALFALRGTDGQLPPAAFALQLIVTRAAAGLEPTVAPAPTVPVMLHRPGQQTERSLTADCGGRGSDDCRCMSMDLTASMLYRSHEPHRRAAA